MIEKWDHQKKIFEIKIPEDVCIINSQISAVILIIWRYTYMLLFLTSAIIKIWLKHSNFVEIANIDIIKIKIDEINACIKLLLASIKSNTIHIQGKIINIFCRYHHIKFWLVAIENFTNTDLIIQFSFQLSRKNNKYLCRYHHIKFWLVAIEDI